MKRFLVSLCLCSLLALAPLASSGGDNARDTTAPGRGDNAQNAAPPGHYLLLVTSVNVTTFTPDSVAQFDRSAYDGVAVPFLVAYDTSDIPSAETMTAKLQEWKKITGKDLWPWIYLNRLIGADPKRKAQFDKLPYFARIRGADLEDTAGAKTDFLKYWANALLAAKNSGAPGIVVDPEFYNYYGEYDVGVLAQQMGKEPSQVVELLKKAGHEAGSLTATVYPSAIIWFLLTDLGNPSWKTVLDKPYYASPAYFVQGLLEELKSRQVPAKVISGGEVSLGYCSTSLAQLTLKIQNRGKAFAPQLQQYPSILQLAGTITLWSEPAGKFDWIKQKCAPSDADTVEQLQPYLELLFRSYRYNWIYASGNGSYYAFRPDSARFDAVIKSAKSRAQ